jgi:hypothetical protein
MIEGSGRPVATWVAGLLVASTAFFVVTVLTAPADSGHDPFDSPVFLPSIGGLAVLCGFAGWFAPRARLLWGLVVAVPYLAGYALYTVLYQSIGASFGPLWLIFLLVPMVVPWLFGLIAGVARQAARRS